MRLIEFISEEELQQLVFDATWRALTTYQQRIATKPAATLKPQAAKTAKALARKAKRPPHAATPKPLPKPQHVPQAKAEATPAYRPVKTAKPLPPTTRMAVAKTQSPSNKAVQQVMPLPPDMDQAARRMLPPNKRGQNPIDLLAPQ
jgi:hypothetical protein